MRIKSFRVQNYKSIIDSGRCYLNDSINILAGKNESGKTSILEALYDFDRDQQIRATAIRILDEENYSIVSVTFTVEQETIEEILRHIGSSNHATSGLDLELIKSFPDKYDFGPETREYELFEHSRAIKKMEYMKNLVSGIHNLLQSHDMPAVERDTFDFDDLESEKVRYEQLQIAIKSRPPQVNSSGIDECLRAIDLLFGEVEDLINLQTLNARFKDTFVSHIPTFVFFDSFQHEFPDTIPFSELQTNDWVKDLEVISDLDASTIQSANERKKHEHKTEVNFDFNQEYGKFWNQDDWTLEMDWSDQVLRFWIREEHGSFEPSLRSSGRRWHLSFYVKVSARAKEDGFNVILIDEPGLFLHATAQRDILNMLEELATNTQIIFSTHSPYLLEPEKLNRVRLVGYDELNGTRINNKIHAGADRETLTPILTAIGLGLNSGVSAIDRVHNVVVEGQSDVFYLNAFKKLLGKDYINFVFGGGAGNMPFVGAILTGWGAKVLYLLDHDKGGRDGRKNLTKNWFVDDNLIVDVSTTSGSVEDRFSKSDFKTFVLGDIDAGISERNSAFIKSVNLEKVLLARKFLDSCQKTTLPELDQETRENFGALFRVFEEKFRR